MSRYRPAQMQSRQLASQLRTGTRPTRNRAGVAPHAASRSSLALAHEPEANAGHGGPSSASQEPSGLVAGPGGQGTSSSGAQFSPNGSRPLDTGGGYNSPSDSSACQLSSQQQQQQPTDEEQRAQLQRMLLLPVAVCQTVTLAPQVRPSLWRTRASLASPPPLCWPCGPHHPNRADAFTTMLTTVHLITGASCCT